VYASSYTKSQRSETMRQLEQSDGQDALGQNRADLGIAEESRFQGLRITRHKDSPSAIVNSRIARPVRCWFCMISRCSRPSSAARSLPRR
jgi:hypothetical protein